MTEPTPQEVVLKVQDGLIRADLGGVEITLSGMEAVALATALIGLAGKPGVRPNR